MSQHTPVPEPDLACGCCLRRERDALGTRYDSVYCPLHAQAGAMREALQKLSEAIRPTRDGKRDGGTFGALSAADDAARAILAATERG